MLEKLSRYFAGNTSRQLNKMAIEIESIQLNPADESIIIDGKAIPFSYCSAPLIFRLTVINFHRLCMEWNARFVICLGSLTEKLLLRQCNVMNNVQFGNVKTFHNLRIVLGAAGFSSHCSSQVNLKKTKNNFYPAPKKHPTNYSNISRFSKSLKLPILDNRNKRKFYWSCELGNKNTIKNWVKRINFFFCEIVIANYRYQAFF